MTHHTLFLFRNDLRLNDNAGLAAACRSGQPVILLYILDETLPEGQNRGLGGAGRWWLHHSLWALAEEIKTRGGRLILRRGGPLGILDEIIAAAGVNRLYFSRGYTPAARAAPWHCRNSPRGTTSAPPCASGGRGESCASRVSSSRRFLRKL